MRGRFAFLACALLVQACGALEKEPPPPPVPPRDLRAEWGDGTVSLTWSAAPNADHYRVYRSTACAGPWERRISTSERAYIDSEIENGETYFFAVSTVDEKEEGNLSIEVRGSPGVTPAAPQGLVAIEGVHRADLVWTPVPGATSYLVERADAADPFRRVAFTTQSSFSSTGLSPTEHRFRVRALAGSVEGPHSAIVPVSPVAESPFEDPSFVQARGFDGAVSKVLPVEDGSGDVYVTGAFAHYGTSQVASIVRLREDGTVDPFFSPPAISYVNDVAHAVDGSGDLFVAGAVDGIVRLNENGSIDGSFDAQLGIAASVSRIAAARDGSGAVYAIGFFLTGGSLKRIVASGELDEEFLPELPFSFSPTALLAAEDGTIWVGGNGALRLGPDGELLEVVGADTGIGGSIGSLAFVDEGCTDVYAGGPFVGGSVLRFRAGGGVHEGFTPPQILLSSVTGLASAGDEFGEIYASGYAGPASPPSPIVRYRADGALDEQFPAKEFAYYVHTLAAVGDGTRSPDVIAGGSFTGYEGVGIDRLARLNADGTLDPSTRRGSGLGGHAYGSAYRIAAARDGSGDVFVAGSFTYYDGELAHSMMRVAPDGTRKDTFVPAIATSGSPTSYVIAPALDAPGYLYATLDVFASYLGRLDPEGRLDGLFAGRSFDNGSVIQVVPLPDGRVWVGGSFDAIEGQTARRIARLYTNGTTDPTFDSGDGFDQTVLAILPAPDGSGDVYVGGNFTSYDVLGNAKRIVRLDEDGTVDAGFVTGAGFNAEVNALADPGDGSGDILVGGAFDTYRGAPVASLVRLDPDGTPDPAFNAAPGGAVHEIAPARDGTGDIWVAGDFGLLRLDADGAVDADFDPGGGFGGPYVTVGDLTLAALLDSSGRVVAGGAFTSYRGATVDGLVRVNADGTID